MISYVFSVFRAALGLVTCVSASNASASSAASDSQSESRDEEASHEASDATEPERRRIPPSAPESPSLPPTSAGSSSFPRLSMSLIRSDIHLCGCGAGFVDASSRRARRGLSPTNSAPLTVALTVPNSSAPLGAPTSPGTLRSERFLPSVRNRFSTRSS